MTNVAFAPATALRLVGWRTQEDKGVARLGVWGTRGSYRDQGAFGVDQEQQVGGRGDPTVGRVGGDAGAGGVAGGQGRAGEGEGEERFARSVGGYRAVAGS